MTELSNWDNGWLEVVSTMSEAVQQPEDRRTVQEAVANLSSGHGLYFTLPGQVAELVEVAVSAGYAQALHDLRDGDLDALVTERAEVLDLS